MILFPALALLFRLTLAGRFREGEDDALEQATVSGARVNVRRLARIALACLIAGFGLLNLANAQWAHAVGVVCLFGFIGLAFRAIVVPALDQQAAVR